MKIYGIKILFVLTFLFTFIFIKPVFPQSKTGTTIAQFLKIEPSSRLVGMGNAGASLHGEISNIFYNPASLGYLKGSDVQFTFNKWLADIDYNYLAAGINIEGVGTLSLTGTMLNSGEINVTTVEQPLGTGEKYTVKNFALGLGYGIMLTDRVSVGVQFNYILETIWHSNLSTIGMNLGVQYQLIDGGLTLGASVSNFGARSSFDGRDIYINYDFDSKKYGDNDQLPAKLRVDEYALPTLFRAGISYQIDFADEYKLLIAADATHPNDNLESINLGGELKLINQIFLRAGFRNLFLVDSEGGLVLGAGLKTEIANSYNIRFDYAFADYGRLSEAHRLTVSLGFE